MTAEPLSKAECLITGAELAAMGDVGSCELVEGSIRMMSPTGAEHGEIEAILAAELRSHVHAHRLGKVMAGEVGIYTGREPDTVRGADLLFISNERLSRCTSTGYLDVAPDLVVEILSPNDRWSEVTRKLREYFAVGVRLIWVVDPSSRSVFAYRSLTDVCELTEDAMLPGADVLPGFALQIATLFV